MSIYVYFILSLSLYSRFEAILVVVDHFTKITYLIPCNYTTNALKMNRLFVSYVFCVHGLPQDIVSDLGPQFASHFWEALLSILRIKPSRSTAFHPQSDGQTERVNQCLETYLRLYTNANHDDWALNLPLAQFSYNNSVHISTKISPLYAKYGYHPSFNLTPRANSVVQCREYCYSHCFDFAFVGLF